MAAMLTINQGKANMSNEQGSGGAPNHDASGDDQGKKDSVSYDTYRKTVSEVKRLKEEIGKMAAENEERNQSVLAEQGKWKEVAEKLQKDLKLKEDEAKRKDAFFVQQNLKQTIGRFAKDMGAHDEAVDEIFEVAKAKKLLDTVELKDDYSVNADHVKGVLAEMQKKSPWFFQKQVAAPKDINLGATPSGVSAKDLSKLSHEQLLELAKNVK